MTADDIVAANPQYEFTPAVIFGREGLSYLDETGKEIGVIWRGNMHVSGPLPWTKDGFQAAKQNLRLAKTTGAST